MRAAPSLSQVSLSSGDFSRRNLEFGAYVVSRNDQVACSRRRQYIRFLRPTSLPSGNKLGSSRACKAISSSKCCQCSIIKLLLFIRIHLKLFEFPAFNKSNLVVNRHLDSSARETNGKILTSSFFSHLRRMHKSTELL